MYYSLHDRPTRDELLGQGIVILFGKPAVQEDGRLMCQRTIFPELEFRFLLILKGEKIKSWFWLDSGGDMLILLAAIRRWDWLGCFL